MPTAFLALTDAVVEALRQAPALAPDIERGRGTPAGLGKGTAIRVGIARGNAKPLDLDGTLQWESSVVVELFARAAAGTDAEQAIDPLLAAAWQRLQAVVAPPGVLGMTLRPSIGWDVDEADQTIVRAVLALDIVHTTGPALAAA